MQGKLFIISAPSGAGKSTLVDAIISQRGAQYRLERFITYTSRVPRGSEREGRDFFYISADEFEQKIQRGFFLEWSNGLGHYYGTPGSILSALEQGVSGILVLDRSGARQLRRHIPEACLIWLKVSDIGELENRLKARGTESAEQGRRRLKRAEQEMDEEQREQMYQYHIINDNLDRAVKDMLSIVDDCFKV